MMRVKYHLLVAGVRLQGSHRMLSNIVSCAAPVLSSNSPLSLGDDNPTQRHLDSVGATSSEPIVIIDEGDVELEILQP